MPKMVIKKKTVPEVAQKPISRPIRPKLPQIILRLLDRRISFTNIDKWEICK